MHASAIVLAWPKSRSWFSVFKDLKEPAHTVFGHGKLEHANSARTFLTLSIFFYCREQEYAELHV